MSTAVAPKKAASRSDIELSTFSRTENDGDHGISSDLYRPRPSIEMLENGGAISAPMSASASINDADTTLGEEGEGRNIHNPTEILPPVDGGHRAWLFLAAATTIEILVWGLPFSIGILHNYWTTQLFHGQGAGTITLAATLQTGLLYILCAFVGPVLAAFPRWTRTIQIAGLLSGALSMITAAFVTQPWHLIVTVGVFYPLSCAFYFPCATLLFEWFHAKRGWASGIMFAGSGVGGCVYPAVMQGLLNRFGYKAAMISLGLGFGLIGGIAMLPIKRRIPLSRYDPGTGIRRRPKVDYSFVKTRPFILGMLTILLTSLGNFVPSLWIPTYADDLGLHKPDGVALISILNAASVVGTAGLGWLSDHAPLRVSVCLSCIGSALACAFLWGFGKSAGTLVTFALFFGLLGPSFSALWSKIIAGAAKDDPSATALVFSSFAVARGIGNLSSGPVSEALLKYRLSNAPGAFGVSNYGILLIYTAVTIMTGGVTGFFFNDK